MLIDHSSAHHLPQTMSALPNSLIWMGSGSLFLLLTMVFGCFGLLRKQIQGLTAELGGRERRTATLSSELEAQALLVRQMSTDLEELRKRLAEHQDSVQPAAPLWATSDMAVNLNRRGQIIRLSRKGKSISEIAQDLNVAQGEVELLLKVHDLSQKKAESGKS